jgi:putative ABC transport system permease protein
MRALNRKLWRDLVKIRVQAAAIAGVIACGVGIFVTSFGALRSLEGAKRNFYRNYHLAEVFGRVQRAPNSLAARVEAILGVAEVQCRIGLEVSLDLRRLAHPASARLISAPDAPGTGLNQLYLRRGRYLDPGRPREVLVSEAFADAHRIEPGDQLAAVVKGVRVLLEVVGVALSPEYVFQIREGDTYPDDRYFGILWMAYPQLAALTGMQGAFNEVSVTLAPGAVEAQVMRDLDRVLDPYGGTEVARREAQRSDRQVAGGIRQLWMAAVIPPAIFLAVSAFMLNTVLNRLIKTQREEIATLRAFGYSHRALGLHYLQLVFLIVGVGVGAGVALGWVLATPAAGRLNWIYHFPNFEVAIDPAVVALAVGTSFLVGVAGALSAVWTATLLPPAEGMRPPAPPRYAPSLFDRVGLGRLVSQPVRIIFRELERQWPRAALSCFGIALALAMLVLGNFSKDAIEYLLAFEFRVTQHQDVTVTLGRPERMDTRYALCRLPGVRECEPFWALPVRVQAGSRSRRLVLMGLPPAGRLYRPVGRDSRAVDLPSSGLVLSAALADVLGVRVGDPVGLQFLTGRRQQVFVPLGAVSTDYVGQHAYMSLPAVSRLLREDEALSGAFLTVDPQQSDQLAAALKTLPGIASVQVKEDTARSFRRHTAQNVLFLRTLNLVFATVIACGVMYNTVLISLSERRRELATMRVLGFTRRETTVILLGEIALLTLAAIPPGTAFGYGLAALAALVSSTEYQRTPLTVSLSTYLFSLAVVGISLVASGLAARRRLDRLDLVASLKAKE